MDFKQGLYIAQRLEQRLVMTQQLQQAIRLLQLSRTELVESIRDSLNENPVLEDQGMAEGGGASQVTGGEGGAGDLVSQITPLLGRGHVLGQEGIVAVARPGAGDGGFVCVSSVPHECDFHRFPTVVGVYYCNPQIAAKQP